MMIRKFTITRSVLAVGFTVFAFACSGDGGDDQGVGADEVGDTEGGASDSTTGSDTDTSTPSEIDEACTQLCELYDTCDSSLTGCMELCVDGHEHFEGECLDAQFAMTQCMTGLSCEELELVAGGVLGDPNAPCAAEVQQLCPMGCDTAAILNDSGCTVELYCGDLPQHDVVCNDQQCVCSIEGEQVGSCPLDEAICGDMDVAAVNACCGWELETF